MIIEETTSRRVQRLLYKNKEIIYTDFRDLDDDEKFVAVAEEVLKFLTKLNRPTLQLTNISGFFLTPKRMHVITTYTPKVEHLILKDAVVGIKGAKRILFQIYNSIVGGKAKTFDDEESAKEWLVNG
jgi:hypothetical protein